MISHPTPNRATMPPAILLVPGRSVGGGRRSTLSTIFSRPAPDGVTMSSLSQKARWPRLVRVDHIAALVLPAVPSMHFKRRQGDAGLTREVGDVY